MFRRAGRQRARRLLVLASVVALAALTPQAAIASPTGTENINLTLPSGLDLSGVVTDPNGDPIADVNVGICPDEFSCFAAAAISSGAGSYTVLGIVPGTYYLRTDINGYVNVWLGPGGSSVTDFASAAAIEITQDVTGIDLQLEAGFSLSGTLFDPDSQPVAGIDVSVSGDGGGGQATTDENGAYTITGLLESWYTFEVRPPAGSPFTTGTVSNGAVIKEFEQGLFLDGNVSGFDVELVEGRTISGTVTGLTQLANANVSNGNYGVIIGEDGTFAIRGLWPDDLQQLFISHEPVSNFDEQFPIGVYDGTSVLATDQSTAALIDTSAGDVDLGTLTAPTLPTITGTVVDDLGDPVPGWVTLCGEVGCASSDLASDGTYAFLNLPDSTFTMYISSGNHLDGYLTASGGVSREYEDALEIVVAGEDQVFDAELLIGMSVSGHISGAGGVALANVGVSVYSESLGYFGASVTDANGDYLITGLIEGDYVMRAYPEGGDYFAGYWSYGGYVQNEEDADAFHVPMDLTVVDSSDPLDGATGVSRSVHPSVTFSGDVTNVSSATVQLHVQESTALLKGTVVYDAGTRTATFTPKTKLKGRTTYVLEVSGVLDTGGLPVPPVSVTFTTGR